MAARYESREDSSSMCDGISAKTAFTANSANGGCRIVVFLWHLMTAGSKSRWEWGGALFRRTRPKLKIFPTKGNQKWDIAYQEFQKIMFNSKYRRNSDHCYESTTRERVSDKVIAAPSAVTGNPCLRVTKSFSAKLWIDVAIPPSLMHA